MTLHHPQPVVITPSYDLPAERITPAVLDALNSGTDDWLEGTGKGHIDATVAMCRKLIRMELAESRGFGVYLTDAGQRVVDLYADQYPPLHRISYAVHDAAIRGSERQSLRDGATVISTGYVYAARCTVDGWGYIGGTRQERRAAVRRHLDGHE